MKGGEGQAPLMERVGCGAWKGLVAALLSLLNGLKVFASQERSVAFHH